MNETPKKRERKRDRDANEGHENDVMIGPLEKNGEKMMKTVEEGGMAAILSKTEVMYVFVYRNLYQCFIHPLDAPNGRHKTFEINEKHRAMLKNLDSTADQIFEIRFRPEMDFMGVMVAAERGIVNFLNSIGQLPAEDFDFMAPLEEMESEANNSGGNQ